MKTSREAVGGETAWSLKKARRKSLVKIKKIKKSWESQNHGHAGGWGSRESNKVRDEGRWMGLAGNGGGVLRKVHKKKEKENDVGHWGKLTRGKFKHPKWGK